MKQEPAYILEEVYHLLGGSSCVRERAWQDEPIKMFKVIEQLMILIAIPEVNNHLSELDEPPLDIAKTLHYLHKFLMRLIADDCQAEMQLYELDNWAVDKSEKKLAEIEKEYRDKNLTIDYKNALKTTRDPHSKTAHSM